jgi:hypothetical protein
MIRNREAILALEGGRLIVEALEAMEDQLTEAPVTIGAIQIRVGDGSPEGRFDDPIGNIYLRTNQVPSGLGTTLYVKEQRNHAKGPAYGWVAK